MIYADYRDISDVKADLLILDPPWNKTNLKFDNAGFDIPDLLSHAKQWIKPSGWIFLFGDLKLASITNETFEYLFDLVWVKPKPSTIFAKYRPLKWHEMIYVFAGGDDKRYYDQKALQTKGEPYTRRRIGNKNWSGNDTEYTKAQGMNQQGRTDSINYGTREGKSVLYYPNKSAMKKAERTPHPTQKPLDLIKLLINGYCPPDGLVIDPTAGSGTTPLAAKMTGRGCIYAESNPEYRKIINQRLASVII